MLNLNDILMGFSLPIYSTWTFYKPDNFMVDCGEGCATALNKKSFAIDRIFLTHGHSDHQAGLPQFLWCRASTMGATTKPLTIYYPENHGPVLELKKYIDTIFRHPPFELRWKPLNLASTVPLFDGRYLTTFPTFHMKGELTLGYTVNDKRKRLKSEYIGLAGTEIRDIRKSGVEVTEEYVAKVACFCGDGPPVRSEAISGAELLVHEATMLDAAEKRGNSHSTLREAVLAAKMASPQNLLLNHVSSRYPFAETKRMILAEIKRECIEIPVWVMQGRALERIN